MQLARRLVERWLRDVERGACLHRLARRAPVVARRHRDDGARCSKVCCVSSFDRAANVVRRDGIDRHVIRHEQVGSGQSLRGLGWRDLIRPRVLVDDGTDGDILVIAPSDLRRRQHVQLGTVVIYDLKLHCAAAAHHSTTFASRLRSTLIDLMVVASRRPLMSI